MKIDCYDKQDRFRFSFHLPISPFLKENKLRKAVKLILKDVKHKAKYIIIGKEKIKL